MIRYGELCMEFRRAIEKTEPDLAVSVSRELIAFAAEKTVEELLRDRDLYVSENTRRKAGAVLGEYLAGKPLAYILGEWSFFGLPMNVTEDVLIPRDDTAVVTALALEKLAAMEEPRVLDLCTGSGCIGLAIAANCPEAKLVLADISPKALLVAKANTAQNRLQSRVTVLQADALLPAPHFLGKFHLIVSNPPYITGTEMKKLQPSVADYEPHLALYGGEDGLDFYRGICQNYTAALHDGGWLCFEFGMGQEDAVEAILKENKFGDLLFCRDTSNIIRAVAARKNGKE